jgi:hypothetical protein
VAQYVWPFLWMDGARAADKDIDVSRTSWREIVLGWNNIFGYSLGYF